MDDLNILFKRYYTQELEKDKDKTVYDLFKWKKVDVKLIDHKTNKVLTDMKNLEFPYDYSQNACDIIASKYFKKAGVPNECGYENSMKMVAHRLVSFWCEALKDEGIIKNKEDASIFYDELAYALLNQMYAPNSPQWFNTGLSLIYGIKGEKQGHFYYDLKQKKVVPSSDCYTRTQASACFIISIEDKLLGPHSISEQYVTETKLFKGGSGTGTNFSTIRAKGEKLSGGGVSSGLMSFLKGLDRNAGAIKSGGTTRRAAKMLCLNVDHPEIMDYITWKAKEEDKVKALGKMGYDASFEGEAYETVSGQNANNSVMLTDEFMKKVCNLDKKPDETIELKGRVDSSVNRKEKVKDIWDAFNKSSWRCADPSPLFSDRLNAWHTCPCGEDGVYNAQYNKINSTNPCGEYAFLNDTSCNLASINLYKFYDENNNSFDVEGYKHIIGLVQLVLEASIHWGQFPTADVARKTHMFRTTGLGVSNLAALLMVMGYPYDSDEGRAAAASLVGILTGYSYYISSLMAKEVGPFEKYDINKKYMNTVIENQARAAGSINTPYENINYEPLKADHKILEKENLKYVGDELKNVWKLAVEGGSKYGYRNAQVSVMAPTGTISFAMDCSSTSIEPFFSHVIYKKLSGGGYMTITNPLIEKALKHLGYSKNEIADIQNYILRKKTSKGEDGTEYETILDGKIEGAPHLKPEHLAVFDTANKCGTGERFIRPMGHILMVASLIPLISGSVSKTVNLPKTATVEDFKNVIIDSWKLGVKGITIYRDSSKESQPLNTSLEEYSSTKPEDMTYAQLLNLVKKSASSPVHMTRERAVGIRTGRTHPAQIGDIKIYTTVNRRANGEISEIYITTDREGTLIMGLLNSLSKSISVMLQYHVPPKDISEMLRGQKYEPYGFVQMHPYIKHVTSISDLISKIIDIELGDFSHCQVKPQNIEAYEEEHHHPEETKISKGERAYDITCPNCSSTRMVKNGTCYVCLDCGTTTGCS
ncbi:MULTISPECIES: vitamin B12-dependent ribonucleotide reductase [Clostridium]|uniref:vitamin B12-dependent ribonucleotide reductase n=1 Tax=Clostridium TaxID=1485 RepID=UPI0008268669|nr:MULTISPECIES: vitamin B12-dependent ribonucleotide reductase [Clostridium]PJI07205.1 ribonucleoside-diphosphate reductase, adenosylcobalamin-dependent [Clostridium sp. CT7]